MKTLSLCALILQTKGAIPEQEVYYETDKPNTYSTTSVSVKTVASDDFAVCQCDLTFGACDVNCCCDKECSQELRTLWKLNAATQCKDYYSHKDQMTLAECKAEINQPDIEDL